jgi:uncharacterized SAM-binding protein YcdF (DUF218 family)
MQKMFSLMALGLLLWSGGFCWFLYDVTHFSHTVPPPVITDGIVVLTGGRGRIEAGLELLKHNQANHLLISGVHDHVNLSVLLKGKDDFLKNRIELDYQATNTIENARAAREWATKHQIRSVIVVTADYHLRRSLLEFAISLPDVHIYPYGVRLTSLEKNFNVSTVLRLAREFNKFLASLIRFVAQKLV